MLRILRRLKAPHTKHPDPQTVDYRTGNTGWGHAISPHGEREPGGIRATGHGPRTLGILGGQRHIQNGDFALLTMRSGEVHRWRFEDVDYFRDPSDMWSASLYDEGPADLTSRAIREDQA